MPFELLVWMVVGLLAVVACHEMTHVLIAHAHGHRTVCIAVNPVGVAVVFEDTPSRTYWGWQVILPMVVTAVLSYGWLFVMVTYPSELQPVFAARGVLDTLPLAVFLMAVLTSGGDIFGLVMEMRSPVWGEERILRDLRILRKVPSVVRFTEYGRDRWEPSWRQIGRAIVDRRAAASPRLE
jgi:hypothetical protein